MRLPILILKMLGIFIWLVLCCCVGLVVALFRWGDPDLDRDFARVYSWGSLKIAGIQVEVRGREHLEKIVPAVYLANHQSGIDMSTLGTVYPSRTVLIGKKEVRWIPFFGLFFMASGNILIDRKNRSGAIAALDEAVSQMRRRNVAIWIFPEGTRNRQGHGILPLKKGAFHVAIQSGAPIIPIVSSTLTPVVSWKHKRFPGGKVKVQVLPPIPTQGLQLSDVDALADKVRQQMIEALHSLS